MQSNAVISARRRPLSPLNPHQGATQEELADVGDAGAFSVNSLNSPVAVHGANLIELTRFPLSSSVAPQQQQGQPQQQHTRRASSRSLDPSPRRRRQARDEDHEQEQRLLTDTLPPPSLPSDTHGRPPPLLPSSSAANIANTSYTMMSAAPASAASNSINNNNNNNTNNNHSHTVDGSNSLNWATRDGPASETRAPPTLASSSTLLGGSAVVGVVPRGPPPSTARDHHTTQEVFVPPHNNSNNPSTNNNATTIVNRVTSRRRLESEGGAVVAYGTAAMLSTRPRPRRGGEEEEEGSTVFEEEEREGHQEYYEEGGAENGGENEEGVSFHSRQYHREEDDFAEGQEEEGVHAAHLGHQHSYTYHTNNARGGGRGGGPLLLHHQREVSGSGGEHENENYDNDDYNNNNNEEEGRQQQQRMGPSFTYTNNNNGDNNGDEFTPDDFIQQHALRATRTPAWMNYSNGNAALIGRRHRGLRRQREGAGSSTVIRTLPLAFPTRRKARITGFIQLICISLAIIALAFESSPIPMILLFPALLMSLTVQFHATSDYRLAKEDSTLQRKVVDGVWATRIRRIYNTRHMSILMIAAACFYAPICTFYCGFPLLVLLFGDSSSIGGTNEGEPVTWGDSVMGYAQLARLLIFASVPIVSIALARYYVLLKDEWMQFCDARQAALWRLALVTIRDLQRRVIDFETIELEDVDSEEEEEREEQEYDDDGDEEGEEGGGYESPTEGDRRMAGLGDEEQHHIPHEEDEDAFPVVANENGNQNEDNNEPRLRDERPFDFESGMEEDNFVRSFHRLSQSNNTASQHQHRRVSSSAVTADASVSASSAHQLLLSRTPIIAAATAVSTAKARKPDEDIPNAVPDFSQSRSHPLGSDEPFEVERGEEEKGSYSKRRIRKRSEKLMSNRNTSPVRNDIDSAAEVRSESSPSRDNLSGNNNHRDDEDEDEEDEVQISVLRVMTSGDNTFALAELGKDGSNVDIREKREGAHDEEEVKFSTTLINTTSTTPNVTTASATAATTPSRSSAQTTPPLAAGEVQGTAADHATRRKVSFVVGERGRGGGGREGGKEEVYTEGCSSDANPSNAVNTGAPPLLLISPSAAFMAEASPQPCRVAPQQRGEGSTSRQVVGVQHVAVGASSTVDDVTRNISPSSYAEICGEGTADNNNTKINNNNNTLAVAVGAGSSAGAVLLFDNESVGTTDSRTAEYLVVANRAREKRERRRLRRSQRQVAFFIDVWSVYAANTIPIAAEIVDESRFGNNSSVNIALDPSGYPATASTRNVVASSTSSAAVALTRMDSSLAAAAAAPPGPVSSSGPPSRGRRSVSASPTPATERSISPGTATLTEQSGGALPVVVVSGSPLRSDTYRLTIGPEEGSPHSLHDDRHQHITTPHVSDMPENSNARSHPSNTHHHRPNHLPTQEDEEYREVGDNDEVDDDEDALTPRSPFDGRSIATAPPPPAAQQQQQQRDREEESDQRGGGGGGGGAQTTRRTDSQHNNPTTGISATALIDNNYVVGPSGGSEATAAPVSFPNAVYATRPLTEDEERLLAAARREEEEEKEDASSRLQHNNNNNNGNGTFFSFLKKKWFNRDGAAAARRETIKRRGMGGKSGGVLFRRREEEEEDHVPIMRVAEGVLVGDYIYSRLCELFRGDDPLVRLLMNRPARFGGEPSSESSASDRDEDGGQEAGANARGDLGEGERGGDGDDTYSNAGEQYSTHQVVDGGRGEGDEEERDEGRRDLGEPPTDNDGAISQDHEMMPRAPIGVNNNNTNNNDTLNGGSRGQHENEEGRRHEDNNNNDDDVETSVSATSSMQGAKGPMSLIAALFNSVVHSQLEVEREEEENSYNYFTDDENHYDDIHFDNGEGGGVGGAAGGYSGESSSYPILLYTLDPSSPHAAGGQAAFFSEGLAAAAHAAPLKTTTTTNLMVPAAITNGTMMIPLSSIPIQHQQENQEQQNTADGRPPTHVSSGGIGRGGGNSSSTTPTTTAGNASILIVPSTSNGTFVLAMPNAMPNIAASSFSAATTSETPTPTSHRGESLSTHPQPAAFLLGPSSASEGCGGLATTVGRYGFNASITTVVTANENRLSYEGSDGTHFVKNNTNYNTDNNNNNNNAFNSEEYLLGGRLMSMPVPTVIEVAGSNLPQVVVGSEDNNSSYVIITTANNTTATTTTTTPSTSLERKERDDDHDAFQKVKSPPAAVSREGGDQEHRVVFVDLPPPLSSSQEASAGNINSLIINNNNTSPSSGLLPAQQSPPLPPYGGNYHAHFTALEKEQERMRKRLAASNGDEKENVYTLSLAAAAAVPISSAQNAYPTYPSTFLPTSCVLRPNNSTNLLLQSRTERLDWDGYHTHLKLVFKEYLDLTYGGGKRRTEAIVVANPPKEKDRLKQLLMPQAVSSDGTAATANSAVGDGGGVGEEEGEGADAIITAAAAAMMMRVRSTRSMTSNTMLTRSQRRTRSERGMRREMGSMRRAGSRSGQSLPNSSMSFMGEVEVPVAAGGNGDAGEALRISSSNTAVGNGINDNAVASFFNSVAAAARRMTALAASSVISSHASASFTNNNALIGNDTNNNNNTSILNRVPTFVGANTENSFSAGTVMGGEPPSSTFTSPMHPPIPLVGARGRLRSGRVVNIDVAAADRGGAEEREGLSAPLAPAPVAVAVTDSAVFGRTESSQYVSSPTAAARRVLSDTAFVDSMNGHNLTNNNNTNNDLHSSRAAQQQNHRFSLFSANELGNGLARLHPDLVTAAVGTDAGGAASLSFVPFARGGVGVGVGMASSPLMPRGSVVFVPPSNVNSPAGSVYIGNNTNNNAVVNTVATSASNRETATGRSQPVDATNIGVVPLSQIYQPQGRSSYALSAEQPQHSPTLSQIINSSTAVVAGTSTAGTPMRQRRQQQQLQPSSAVVSFSRTSSSAVNNNNTSTSVRQQQEQQRRPSNTSSPQQGLAQSPSSVTFTNTNNVARSSVVGGGEGAGRTSVQLPSGLSGTFGASQRGVGGTINTNNVTNSAAGVAIAASLAAATSRVAAEAESEEESQVTVAAIRRLVSSRAVAALSAVQRSRSTRSLRAQIRAENASHRQQQQQQQQLPDDSPNHNHLHNGAAAAGAPASPMLGLSSSTAFASSSQLLLRRSNNNNTNNNASDQMSRTEGSNMPLASSGQRIQQQQSDPSHNRRSLIASSSNPSPSGSIMRHRSPHHGGGGREELLGRSASNSRQQQQQQSSSPRMHLLPTPVATAMRATGGGRTSTTNSAASAIVSNNRNTTTDTTYPPASNFNNNNALSTFVSGEGILNVSSTVVIGTPYASAPSSPNTRGVPSSASFLAVPTVVAAGGVGTVTGGRSELHSPSNSPRRRRSGENGGLAAAFGSGTMTFRNNNGNAADTDLNDAWSPSASPTITSAAVGVAETRAAGVTTTACANIKRTSSATQSAISHQSHQQIVPTTVAAVPASKTRASAANGPTYENNANRDLLTFPHLCSSLVMPTRRDGETRPAESAAGCSILVEPTVVGLAPLASLPPTFSRGQCGALLEANLEHAPPPERQVKAEEDKDAAYSPSVKVNAEEESRINITATATIPNTNNNNNTHHDGLHVHMDHRFLGVPSAGHNTNTSGSSFSAEPATSYEGVQMGVHAFSEGRGVGQHLSPALLLLPTVLPPPSSSSAGPSPSASASPSALLAPPNAYITHNTINSANGGFVRVSAAEITTDNPRPPPPTTLPLCPPAYPLSPTVAVKFVRRISRSQPQPGRGGTQNIRVRGFASAETLRTIPPERYFRDKRVGAFYI